MAAQLSLFLLNRFCFDGVSSSEEYLRHTKPETKETVLVVTLGRLEWKLGHPESNGRLCLPTTARVTSLPALDRAAICVD